MSVPGILVHGTALVVGRHGVLVRGRSGSGKSTLALDLLERAARAGRFARLVADDQVFLAREGEALIARAPATTVGLVELHGRGILTLAAESAARIALLVDLVEPEAAERMPAETGLCGEIRGVVIARQPVPIGARAPALIVEAALAALA